MEPEGLDESGFSDARYAGDADADAVAAVGQHLLKYLLGLLAVTLELTLHQGDSLGECAAVAVQECL